MNISLFIEKYCSIPTVIKFIFLHMSLEIKSVILLLFFVLPEQSLVLFQCKIEGFLEIWSRNWTEICKELNSTTNAAMVLNFQMKQIQISCWFVKETLLLIPLVLLLVFVSRIYFEIKASCSANIEKSI